MRRAWLVLALAAAGCFSESPTSSDCVDGEAACSCRPDATCAEGLECVASIDKCTPVGCSPGTATCTCVDGVCLTGLACEGGVCISPPAATTGGEASISTSSTVDTVADTTTGPGTTLDTATTAMTSDATIPPLDTGNTDPTGMTATVSTDATATESGATETMIDVCPGCIDLSAGSACGVEHGGCMADDAIDGCAQLMECLIEGFTPADQCCAISSPIADLLWNALVGCAEMDTCIGNCPLYCN